MKRIISNLFIITILTSCNRGCISRIKKESGNLAGTEKQQLTSGNIVVNTEFSDSFSDTIELILKPGNSFNLAIKFRTHKLDNIYEHNIDSICEINKRNTDEMGVILDYLFHYSFYTSEENPSRLMDVRYLNFDSTGIFNIWPDEAYGFLIGDFNFDYRNDVYIFNPNASGNSFPVQTIWTYKMELQKLVMDSLLSSIPICSINKKDQVIIACSGTKHGLRQESFRLINGKFVKDLQ